MVKKVKNVIVKIAIIFIAYAFIFVWLIYRIQGEAVTLLPLDVKYGFVLNRNTLFAIIITLSVLLLFCLYAVMNVKKCIRFRWNVRIWKFQMKFGSLKTFYSNINRIAVGGGVLSVILIALLFLNSFNKTVDDSWNVYPIAHAMGGIDGYDYTNSLDAFEYNYELGHRVFEVDFSVTSDGKMVCCHDWNIGYQAGIDAAHISSEEVFKATPILGKYTPLTLEEVLFLMKEYKDIYIVTDTKSASNKISEHFEIILNTAYETGAEEVLDRIIVQIYKGKTLELVREVYDFPIIIYTLYSSGWDESAEGFLDICRFCKKNNIRNITMWHYLATPEILEIAKSYNIDVFVHTVNDIEAADELIQSGVKGVYTDELIPDMFYRRDE